MGILGKKIKKYRDENNLTQIEFANLVGVKQSYISRWENKGEKPIYKKHTKKIANILGIDESLLFVNDKIINKIKISQYNIHQKLISQKKHKIKKLIEQLMIEYKDLNNLI
ncbi:MAG: helix-turn-helix domain-containing protein [Candidatus Thorarchaeota archaeon]